MSVCLFSFFFSLPAVLAFFTIKRTHSHKQGRCEDPRKGRKETESSSLHSIGLRSMGSNNNRSHKWTRKKLLTQIGVKKRRGKDAPMFFSLIYFFAPHSIFYILHNYVIPQAMSRAIRQTHSAFYPHRYRCLVSDWWIGEVSHFIQLLHNKQNSWSKNSNNSIIRR